jgi:hypothetical protein
MAAKLLGGVVMSSKSLWCFTSVIPHTLYVKPLRKGISDPPSYLEEKVHVRMVTGQAKDEGISTSGGLEQIFKS